MSEHLTVICICSWSLSFFSIGRSPRDVSNGGSPWQQCSPVSYQDSRSMKLEPRRLSDSKDLCHNQPRRPSDGRETGHSQRGTSSVVATESPSPHRTVPTDSSFSPTSSQGHNGSPLGTTAYPPLTPSPHSHGSMKYPSQSPSSTHKGKLPSPGTPSTPLQGYIQRGGQHNMSAGSSLSPSPCGRMVGSDSTLSPSPCRGVGSDRMATPSATPGLSWSTGSSPATPLLPVPTQWTASLSRVGEAEQKSLVRLATLYARLITGK